MHLTRRQQWTIVGAIVGAAVGAVLALMLAEDQDGETSIGWRELSQLAATLGTLMRQVNELASPPER